MFSLHKLILTTIDQLLTDHCLINLILFIVHYYDQF